MIEIPKEIEHYLTDEKNVPLVEVEGTKWYYISKKEKELLSNILSEIDKIPENVWRKWPEETISKYSHIGNLADRIIRNAIVKDA